MTEISITRALAQVKALNDRIARATSVVFVTTTVGGKHASGKPAQEVGEQLKSNLQSVQALIEQRKAIKSAIVRSNAVTNVVIAGVTQTVAEAIERKSSIVLEQTLLQQLRVQQAQAVSAVERTNVAVAARLDDLIKTAVGKDRQVTAADLAAITTPFEAQNKAEVLDPSDITKVIEQLTTDIDAFLLEVDFALSEVNATTKIVV
ncbi:hypothetical protein CNR37_00150 [Pseudomonas phage ventosus]|uniref:Tail fiber protein n=1 Tax=Pseudomonas phage ventosus TaxID=2048980 RepID=A0A2H4P859_9CAUD|nr:hypothetical protein CNR37_00150 [Pseudomonas phage ventosus]